MWQLGSNEFLRQLEEIVKVVKDQQEFTKMPVLYKYFHEHFLKNLD